MRQQLDRSLVGSQTLPAQSPKRHHQPVVNTGDVDVDANVNACADTNDVTALRDPSHKWTR